MTGRKRWAVVVVVACLASLAFGVEPAFASSPVSWSPPTQIDHHAPFSRPQRVSDVSCPSASVCVAIDADGNVVTSANPTGGTAAWAVANIDQGYILEGVSCPSTSLCVAVDNGGHVFTSTDPTGGAAAWTTPGRVDNEPFWSVSCPSASLCVAVDSGGNVVTSTDPTGDATAWTATHVDGNQFPTFPLTRVFDVSCTSTPLLCVAVDEFGKVITSTNPTGGAGAWTAADADGANTLYGVSCTSPSASTSTCIATDGYGNVVTSTNPTGGAVAWTVTNVDSNALYDVSCPTASLCVVDDQAGSLLTSTDPTGGATKWSSPVDIDSSGTLFGLSCDPTATLCVVADTSGSVVTSTNPTAGAAAWTLTGVDGLDSLGGVSCASASLCVAVDDSGNVVTSTDPTGGGAAWTVAPVDSASVGAVSCPSASLCVAVDNEGNVVTSTDPTGGAAAWSPLAPVDSANSLAAVSCPSTSFCAAVDSNGDVVTSTDPAGGSSAWSAPVNVDGTNYLSGVSCPTASFCVAVDGNGNVVTSTNPTGGTADWTVTGVDGTSFLTAVSCPSTSLCVGVDENGNALTSTNPAGGAQAWNVAQFKNATYLGWVSCLSTSLCVAVGNNNVTASTDPAGGAATWSAPLAIDSSSPALNGVSCSVSLCVAVDSDGNAVAGVVVPPKNSTAPHITGTAREGRVLSAHTGGWSGVGPIRYTYQWRRCGKTGLGCTPVARATHVSYKLTPADVGHKVSVVVTATNVAGHTSASATPVGPVAKPHAPHNTRRPSIRGTTHKGHRLTTTHGFWSSPDRLKFSYRWERCSKTGSGCTNIRGATGISYKLTTADLGRKITVVATATDQEHQSTAAKAAPVGPVKA